MVLPVGPVEVAATQERRMYVTRADIGVWHRRTRARDVLALQSVVEWRNRITIAADSRMVERLGKGTREMRAASSAETSRRECQRGLAEKRGQERRSRGKNREAWLVRRRRRGAAEPRRQYGSRRKKGETGEPRTSWRRHWRRDGRRAAYLFSSMLSSRDIFVACLSACFAWNMCQGGSLEICILGHQHGSLPWSI